MSLLLKTTPFHRRTFALSQAHAWRRWAGYVMASSYELSHEREYAAIRNAAALFDVTPLYKYHVTGRDAAALLDRVVTRDIAQVRGRAGPVHALVRSAPERCSMTAPSRASTISSSV